MLVKLKKFHEAYLFAALGIANNFLEANNNSIEYVNHTHTVDEDGFHIVILAYKVL